jgi:hypothetical protein
VAERVVLMHVPDTHFTAGRAIDAGVVVPTLVMQVHPGSLLVLYPNAHERCVIKIVGKKPFLDA